MSNLSKDNFFSSERKAFFFVLEEFFLILLIVLQAYFLLGIERQGLSLIFFSNPILPQNVLWFVSTILFFVTLYFGISMRDKKVIKVHQEFSKIIFGTAKQKIFGMNRQFFVLILFEISFAIIIALSIYIYLDPDVNIVPWPFNFISFFALLAFGIFIFSKTKLFRESVYEPSILRKKILPAERIFPTRRITKKKSGIIRVQRKR